MSLPSRERGLKSVVASYFVRLYAVAPFAGAWIEIVDLHHPAMPPHKSLPSRERGLKWLS